MGIAAQVLKKVSYGEPREAKLDWKIRQVTKDIFKDPLDVIGQNVHACKSCIRDHSQTLRMTKRLIDLA